MSAVFNAPNTISFIRLALIPVFIWLVFGAKEYGWAGVLLGVIGATDWIDGYIARRYNQVTEVGKFLDPLKYKIRPGRPVAHKHRAALMAIIKERGKRLDNKHIRPASEPLAKIPETHDGALGVEDDF